MRGDSFRRQTAMAQDWCLRNGYTLDDSLTFNDLGVSAFRGANSETGRLGDFLEAVKAGQVPQGSVLLVEALDRISRLTPRKAVKVLEGIIEEGITVVTVSDGRVYTEQTLDEDPISLLLAIMLFMRANEESATKARRLRAAWEAKRAKATEKPLTSVLPGWLRLNKETGKIEKVPERVRIVRRIFQMTLKGYGMEAIAYSLNQKGEKPWGRASHWQRSYIKKVQESEAVLGIYTPYVTSFQDGARVRTAQEPVKNYYPPVISEEDFRSVQAMKAGRTSPKQRKDSPGLQSILAGLAACPLCGSTMTRVMKGDAKKAGRPKLVCVKAKTGRGCTYHGVTLEAVEHAIEHNYQELIHSIPSSSVDLDKEWEKLQTALEATEDAIESTLQAIEQKPLKSLLKRLEELEISRDQIKEEALQLADRIASASNKVMDKRAGDVLTVLKERPLDIPRVNAGLRLLFDRIVVNWKTGSLECHWKHGGVSEITFGMPME